MGGRVIFRREFPVKGGDFCRAGAVACRIKDLLKELGLDTQAIRRAAIASYEAEMNVIMYAWEGRMKLAVKPGEIRITVDDKGPGIPDIGLALLAQTAGLCGGAVDRELRAGLRRIGAR
ncbi:MAG TPA: hypothetical protein VMS75_00125 [Terriglobales bacterium]|nr:hypothetical protein [Terriglobales bacterium]